MLYKKVCGIASGLVLFCGVASAQYSYNGVNLAFLKGTADNATLSISGDPYTFSADDASLAGIYGRLGLGVNEHLSFEGRVGLGAIDDEVTVNFTNKSGRTFSSELGVKLDAFFGGYIRVGTQASKDFYPYVIVGITQLARTYTLVNDDTISESDSSSSFGVGFDFGHTESGGFNVEYMNYYDANGISVTGFSFGLVTKF